MLSPFSGLNMYLRIANWRTIHGRLAEIFSRSIYSISICVCVCVCVRVRACLCVCACGVCV